jgi:hypothetical protein
VILSWLVLYWSPVTQYDAQNKQVKVSENVTVYFGVLSLNKMAYLLK